MTFTSLDDANREVARLMSQLAEANEAHGQESLKVIELQGLLDEMGVKFDGRKEIIEALAKELAIVRSDARFFVSALLRIAHAAGYELPKEIHAQVRAAGLE